MNFERHLRGVMAYSVVVVLLALPCLGADEKVDLAAKFTKGQETRYIYEHTHLLPWYPARAREAALAFLDDVEKVL